MIIKMGNLLFDILVLYIPTIFLLFSMGHITYVFGEFQHKVHTIPKTLLFIGMKVASIVCLQTFIFFYSFKHGNIEHYEVIQLVLAFYITIELYLTNMLLVHYMRYVERHLNKIVKRICYKDFDILISKITTKLARCYSKFVMLLKISGLVFFTLLVFQLNIQFSQFIFSMLVIMIFLTSINISIVKN